MAKHKQVKTSGGVPLASSKTPRVEVGIEFYKRKPAWRISLLEMCDPYGWQEITRDKLAEIRTKLSSFESLTWNDILVVQGKRNHAIPKDRLSPEAQKRLDELRLDDIDSVISLRLTGPNRVFGIKQADALLLLWWDPNHQVCPSAE